MGKGEERKSLDSAQVKELAELFISFQIGRDDDVLKRLFELHDRDGNGSISANELRTTMKAVCPEDIFEESICSIMREADLNGNGEIEFGEFKIYMINRRDS